MTTTAVVIEYLLISWKAFSAWSRWHVEVAPGLTRCGVVFDVATVQRKTVSSLHGVPDLCATCAKHTPPRAPSIDVNAPLTADSLAALLVQAGLRIVTASHVGVIAQCTADDRGVRLHRAVLQPDADGTWQGSYAIALPNRRLGQPRIHTIVSRHVLVRDPLELVLWLYASERAAQKAVV